MYQDHHGGHQVSTVERENNIEENSSSMWNGDNPGTPDEATSTMARPSSSHGVLSHAQAVVVW